MSEPNSNDPGAHPDELQASSHLNFGKVLYYSGMACDAPSSAPDGEFDLFASQGKRALPAEADAGPPLKVAKTASACCAVDVSKLFKVIERGCPDCFKAFLPGLRLALEGRPSVEEVVRCGLAAAGMAHRLSEQVIDSALYCISLC
jgi:hypothetical protein